MVYDPTMQFFGFSGCSVSLKPVDIVENRLKSSFIWGIKWYDIGVKDEGFYPNFTEKLFWYDISAFICPFVSGIEEDWKQE